MFKKYKTNLAMHDMDHEVGKVSKPSPISSSFRSTSSVDTSFLL